MMQKLRSLDYPIKKLYSAGIWIFLFLLVFCCTFFQSGYSQSSAYEPSPSYTGPLYAGDSLYLIANPPGEGPYYYSWTGPNAFYSSEENPYVGIADMGHSGIYTLQMFDNFDNESTIEINVEVVEEEIGMQYESISMNYKDYGLYTFDFTCATCAEEDGNNISVMPSPPMVLSLSNPQKQTTPNIKGPPSCITEINNYTGNFFVQVPLISISGLGPELSIDFVYNSCNSGLNYGYGYGWTFNYNLVWERIGSEIHVHRGDGREDIFQYNSGSYISPNGISDTLIDLGGDSLLLRSKYGMEYHFADSAHRRLTKVKDRNNNELTLDYTDSVATTITGACGRSLHLEYTDGLLTVIKDNNPDTPRLTHFEYDPLQNLRKITDPLDHSEDFIYDIDHKILQIIDKRSNIVQIEYNSENAVTSLKSAVSEMYLSYDKDNNKTIVNQPVGASIQTTTYNYDSEGRAVQIDGNCCGYNIQYQYNSNNDITRITDAKGLDYSYTYDGWGNVLTETDPLNSTQEFQYDPQFSQLASWKDKNGNLTSSSFDTSGNVTSITFPDGGSMNYTYYDNGLLKTSTNGEGHTTSLEYNSYGNRIALVHPIGSEYFTYDEIGNISSSVTPNSDTTYHEYDAMRQRIKTTDPLGNSIQSHYDPNGNVIWSRNKRGFVTTSAYDAHNRLIKTTEPLEKINVFNYDQKDNLISRIDPNGNETLFTYNIRNQIISETDALGNTRFWEYDANGNLINETNFRGFSTIYTYDNLNRRSSVTDALGYSTTYQYDANGNNTSITSPDGISSIFQYDEMDFLKSKQHSFNHSNNEYDKNGNLIAKEDALGNIDTYEYDANDRLTKITDALGQEMNFQYDDNGNRILTTDKMGNANQTFYDAMDQSILQINALGDSIIMSYDEAGNEKTITNEKGFTTEYIYDELNRTTSIQYPIGIHFFTYDKNGNIVSESDAESRITLYEYDAISQLKKITYADGSSVQYSYDENLNLLSFENELNETTSYLYDDLDQNISITNEENETITFSYDNANNKTQIILPNGNIINQVYDKESRLISTYDILGTREILDFDDNGNIILKVDANANFIQRNFDELNRIQSAIDAMGRITEYHYDANNNLLNIVDREGNDVSQTFDELNRRISQTNPLNRTTLYNYDKLGNLSKISDANDNITVFEYDGNNRIIQQTFADNTTKEFSYAQVGNIISRKDNNGNVTQYTYDQRNRLILKDHQDNNDDHFDYDAAGKIINASNNNVDIFFGYDNAGRKTFESLNGETTYYSYDISGRKKTIKYPGNREIEVHRNYRQLIDAVRENINDIATYNYDSGNRILSKNRANNINTTYSYNANNWQISILHTSVTDLKAGYNYDYNNEGYKIIEENVQNPNHSELFTLDNSYRNIRFEKGILSTDSILDPIKYEQFSYDALGNRSVADDNGLALSYSVNDMNEYSAIVNDSTIQPVFDDNGNQLFDGLNNFTYDSENRLLKIEGDELIEFQYDPFGRRIKKTTPVGITQYYYDGWQVIEERGDTTNATATFIYGREIDEVLSIERNGQSYHYLRNSQGSITALTDSAGNVVERYAYDTYGKTHILDDNYNDISSSQAGNPYMYTGRRYDKETELYYNRLRYYDPNLGRFINRDPIGYLQIDNNPGMNLYEYVSSQPTNNIDPFGLIKLKARYTDKVNLMDKDEIPLLGKRHDDLLAKFEFTTGWKCLTSYPLLDFEGYGSLYRFNTYRIVRRKKGEILQLRPDHQQHEVSITYKGKHFRDSPTQFTIIDQATGSMMDFSSHELTATVMLALVTLPISWMAEGGALTLEIILGTAGISLGTFMDYSEATAKYVHIYVVKCECDKKTGKWSLFRRTRYKDLTKSGDLYFKE